MTVSTGKAILHTNKGDITIELFGHHAPKTVANFAESREGREGVVWMRRPVRRRRGVLRRPGLPPHHQGIHDPGRLPLGTGTGGPGYTFDDEIHPELSSTAPTCWRWRTPACAASKGTNGSQFFISTIPTPWLNGKHTIFGEVVDEGSKKVVDAIEAVPTGAMDRPKEPVVMGPWRSSRRDTALPASRRPRPPGAAGGAPVTQAIVCRDGGLLAVGLSSGVQLGLLLGFTPHLSAVQPWRALTVMLVRTSCTCSSTRSASCCSADSSSGRWATRYLFVYVLSGLGGSAAVLLLAGPFDPGWYTLHVGASGRAVRSSGCRPHAHPGPRPELGRCGRVPRHQRDLRLRGPGHLVGVPRGR